MSHSSSFLLLAVGLVSTNLIGCAHAPNIPGPLSKALSGPHAVLLGEVHDNAAVHAFRLAALRESLEAGWRPAIALEQFDREKQTVLDQIRATPPVDVDRLIAEAAPFGKGWNWDYYRPVLALAIKYNLPIVAANLSRANAAKVAKQGFAAALSDQLIAQYGLKDDLPSVVLNGQRQAVDKGHCGQLPAAMLESMAKAQIARDVVMAESIKPYLGNRGVVLLAGNGHVRRDIGVPYWLPDTVSVGLLEQAEPVAFDQSVVLPTQTRADPCAGLSVATLSSK
ncbi:ChaN family lipoprotein [Chitinimonas sp. PSY-7]|uniref:ChaN family lipoprotein n=1 Tax=Chitinimonas sp. PSY-7 TaxID=3459088 RepID=UPI0040402A45